MTIDNTTTKKIKIIKKNTLLTNKGKGAGGSNTNKNGKEFESISSNEDYLLKEGYIRTKMNNNKTGYYLSKKYEDKEVIYLFQSGLKYYMLKNFNIDLFRNPDEAYIIKTNNGKIYIKILEKKEQNVEGSVETKLWSGPSLKREYEIVIGDNFIISYAYSLSDFLSKK